MSKTYNIGVEATIDVIGGKWKPVMLCHLQNNGRMRTSALKRAIPTITQKMLTQQLRELEKMALLIASFTIKCLQKLNTNFQNTVKHWGKFFHHFAIGENFM